MQIYLRKFIQKIQKFAMDIVLPKGKRAAIDSKPTSDDVVAPKIHAAASSPKRKTRALLLMYWGWGYYGMQRNPPFPTIESELLTAFRLAGYCDEPDNYAFGKMRFQRASKTDKSVSALGQVCSLQLPTEDGIASKLNNLLPPHIRVLDAIRTTRNFSAKNACSHREYQYVLPTFAFAPSNLPGGESAHWSYRLSAQRLTEFNTILARYVGTHHFYNFTSGRVASDKSCWRYIISMECEPPFLMGEREFTVINIVGQSFMLHQIRKMIGLAIAIVRGHTTPDVFDIAFGKERVDIPKAPSLGLLLKRVDYTRYNQKYGNDGMHQPIDWKKYEDEVYSFKLQFVYDHMVKQETESKSMLEWLSSLSLHTYYFRPSGPPNTRTQESSYGETNTDDAKVEKHDEGGIEVIPVLPTITISEVVESGCLQVHESTKTENPAVSKHFPQC